MAEKWAKDGSQSSCGMPPHSNWKAGDFLGIDIVKDKKFSSVEQWRGEADCLTFIFFLSQLSKR